MESIVYIICASHPQLVAFWRVSQTRNEQPIEIIAYARAIGASFNIISKTNKCIK